jgi:TRAP-type C4-dicarboxylate transport system permease small subunit
MQMDRHHPAETHGLDDSDRSGIERALLGLLELVGAGGVLCLMLLTVSDGLLRTFANRPILGADDYTQVTLALVVSASLPLCVASGRAIAVDLLVRLAPPNWGRVARFGAALLSAVTLGFLSWRCFVNSLEASSFGETTTLLQIPYGPFYLAMAIGMAVSALIFLVDMIRGRGAL